MGDFLLSVIHVSGIKLLQKNRKWYDEFGSRDQLIVADRVQNFDGHSKYRSRAFQQKKIEVIRPRKRCVKLIQSRYGLGNFPMRSALDLNINSSRARPKKFFLSWNGTRPFRSKKFEVI